MAIVFGGPAQHYQVLNWRGDEDEPAVFNALRQADTVLVDEQELLQLFAWYAHVVPETDGPELAQACRALMENFSLRELIVTLDVRGVWYFDACGSRLTGHAVDPPPCVDAEGADDAFSSVFLLGRALGWPLEQTLARAGAFAGAICGIAGALPPDGAIYGHYSAIWLCR
jgi:fructokinase